ncbi:leishmanolysin-related zinc metalloendopeptidase [Croceivirga sp. JEA036]|uniref:leishmanolysin-related zinc metalloendopeptidase n=1 Tax=Croceivirga sp. JEA036 TaxID=2721162 RepID=UPI00143AC65C|nr:leishmanolysin-related zinc metalloendopeptidase [Croceivirga sp. JEA036]
MMKKNLLKNRFSAVTMAWKTMTWGVLSGLFLLSSCTEETTAEVEETVLESQKLSFTLAPDPSELIVVEGITDAGAIEKTTSAAGPDRGRFNITLKYLIPPSERQQAVFEAAAERWERIIIKDVPSFTGTLPSAFQGVPPVLDNETVDDVIIEVVLAPIDGPGQILGQAGPRFVRTSDYLTLSGVMFFDIDDLDFLDQIDLFEEVIVHEMGHVLGVGTLWNAGGRTLLQGSAEEPFFAGKKANVFWNAEGGAYELPIENTGGPGTAYGHWRESVLNNELMTGYLNLGENPLSRITAGSMKDLGYGAASVGESYDLPKGTEGVNTAVTREADGDMGIHIAEREILLQPIGVVNIKK